MTQPNSMYLVLPVPFRMADGRVFVECQAANGLDRWADHFDRVIVAAPVIPETEVQNLAGFCWRDMDLLQHHGHIKFQPLPWAYTPRTFIAQLSAVRKQIGGSIAECAHLQFAIGGLVGDWAAIAALEAAKQKRRYAIHTDRVEHEVMLKTASSASGLRRLKIAVEAPMMQRYHEHLIRLCSLGLWHGDDCFRAYSPWCAESHLVHDIHTKQSDLIPSGELVRKLEDIRTAATLNLCYAGRLDPMKAPLEWLRAIAAARDLGAPIRATWYGEGPMMDEARSEARRLQLDNVVDFAGFVLDRSELLGHVRAAHAMVFTHVTPESPRNLLESLVSGTPILGYDNAYAVNLIEEKGGGELVPVHDFQSLGRVIAELTKDRERLVKLTQQAANNGSRFTDAAVFAERSALIKQFA